MSKLKFCILLFIATCLSLSAQLSAKSMKDIWLSMPDSLLPYLNKNLKTELIDLADMKVKAEVTNLLDGKTVLDTLTADYLSVRLTRGTELQLKRLHSIQGDSLLCVVRTFMAPEPESTVSLYTMDWVKLKDCSWPTTSLLQKPDTMSLQRFHELQLLIEPALVKASLKIDEDVLLLQLSSGLVDEKDKIMLQPILLQRKLKWTGDFFN